jgi:predicted nucleic acid-binding protein
MIIVLADTSPINYLVQIAAVDVLAHFFDQIVIPKWVQRELLNSATPEVVRKWISEPPTWIYIRSALHVLPLNLDPGETEAIALAKEIGAFAVLLDDADARQAAKKEGLHVTGTVGILERAAAENLLDLPQIFAKLRATNYYASDELLQAALNRDAARKRGI